MAADSILAWQAQWFELRQELLAAVSECLTLYKALFYQKKIKDHWWELFNTCLDHISHLRELPLSFGERFQKEQADLMDWTGNVSTFLEQFGGHDPSDADQQLSRLMRYNLKEGIKNLSKAQSALRIIAEATHAYFPFRDLDEGEKKSSVPYPK